MPAVKPLKSPRQSDDAYFKDAIDWEADRFRAARKSARIAWVIAIVNICIALCSVAAVAMLTPLKTVEPFVVRVDSATGIVDIVTSIKNQQSSYDEAINKYFIAKYIISRESYSFETRNYNYRIVGLMSAPEQAGLYAEWFDPRRNPAAPLAIFGEYASCTVNIKNISFIDKAIALVRFTKNVRRSSDVATSHWVATLSFKYTAGNMEADDRLINPLGFQCVDYRLDPETVGQ